MVEPRKMYSQKVPVAFKVTMASLGPDAKDSSAASPNKTAKPASSRNTLMLVHQKDGEFALCTLIPTIHEQQPLDIVFTEGEMIHLRVQGENPVHLTGYYLEDQSNSNSDEDECDSEMEHVDDLDDESACEGASEEDDDDEDMDEYETEESDEEDTKNLCKSKKRQSRHLVYSEEDDSEEDDDYDSEDAEEEVEDSDMEDDEELDSEDEEDDDDYDSEDDLDDSDEEEVEESKDEEEVIRQELKLKRPANDLSNNQKKTKTDPQAAPSSDKKQKTQKGETSQKENKLPVASLKKETQAADKSEKTVEKSQTPKAEKTPTTESKSNNATPSKSAETSTSASPALVSKTLPSGIQYEDVKSGSGIKVHQGRRVGIEYEIFGEDGKLIESNKGKEPLFFSHMDRGHEVHRGIHLGIAGMALGGERKITIPAKFTDNFEQPAAMPKGKNVTVQVKVVKVVSKGDNKTS